MTNQYYKPSTTLDNDSSIKGTSKPTSSQDPNNSMNFKLSPTTHDALSIYKNITKTTRTYRYNH